MKIRTPHSALRTPHSALRSARALVFLMCSAPALLLAQGGGQGNGNGNGQVGTTAVGGGGGGGEAARWSVVFELTGTKTINGSAINFTGGTTTPDSISQGVQIATDNGGTTPITSTVAVQGTFKVTVTWIGTGPMPTNEYVRMYSFSKSQWSGGSGSYSGSDGLSGTLQQFSGNGWARGEWKGVSFKKITQSPMVLQVSANAAANVTGDPSSVGGNIYLQAVVTKRAVETSLVSPVFTYTHNAAFSAVLNGEDPLTGVQYDDIGISGTQIGTDSAGHPIFEYDWTYTMLGVVDGGLWNLPLSSLVWSGHPGNWFSTSTNLAQGLSTTERRQGSPKISDARANSMFSGPEVYNVTCTATDSFGSEYGRHVVRLHAPVQSTGLSWRSEYQGDLSLAPGISGYTRLPVFQYTNSTYNTQAVVNITIGDSKSYTFGVTNTHNISVSGGVQVLHGQYGFDYSKNTTETYVYQQTYSVSVTVPARSVVTFYVYPGGTVVYPRVSQWASNGYLGLADIADVDWSLFGLSHDIASLDP